MQSVKDVWLVNQNDELKSCVHPPQVAGIVFSGSKPFWDSPEKTTPTASGDGITVVVKEKHIYRQKATGFLAYASEKHSTISQSIRSLLSPGDDGFVLFGELKTVLSKKSMNPPYPGTRSFKWTEHSKKEIDNHENSRCCMF